MSTKFLQIFAKLGRSRGSANMKERSSLGNASEVSQNRVEDRHQTQEQEQVRSVSTEPRPLPEIAAAALFTHTLRGVEPAHLLGRRHLAVKRSPALAAAVAAQSSPALHNANYRSRARTAHVLAGATGAS
jgi:hypothetical protein